MMESLSNSVSFNGSFITGRVHGNLFKVARRGPSPARPPPSLAPTCHYYAAGVTYFLVPSIHSWKESIIGASANKFIIAPAPVFQTFPGLGRPRWNAKQTVAARIISKFLTLKRLGNYARCVFSIVPYTRGKIGCWWVQEMMQYVDRKKYFR